MRITVFGASGKVGGLVVGELLKRGHRVTAFVHSQTPFEETKQLQVIKGDVFSEADVEKALHNAEAVISCLGSWNTKQKNVLSSAMENIVPAMEKLNIKRIITLTGAAITLEGDTKDFWQKITSPLFNLIAHKILADGASHIAQLKNSRLVWTTLRSPIMDNSPISAYLLDKTPPKPWDKTGRQAIAKAMVDLAESEMFACQSPFIH